MSEKDRNREDPPGRPKIEQDQGNGSTRDRKDSGNEDRSTVDKLIDKAQEKGVFEKAARKVQDQFKGGNKGR